VPATQPAQELPPPAAPVLGDPWASRPSRAPSASSFQVRQPRAARGRTVWSTADRCDGTVTHVKEGAVLVRTRHTGRRVLVTAGHRYLARHTR